jgi:hypothetical protein
MSGVPHRFGRIRTVATFALLLSLAGSAAILAYAAYAAGRGDPGLAVGLTIGAVVAITIGVIGYCQLLLLIKFVSNQFRTYDALLDTTELLRRQAELARTVAENSSLSDWAKRTIYREKDFEFLRDTIHSALVRQDWEAAEHLIKDIEQEFGYREEARRMREELERARQATFEEKVAAALGRFEMLCASQKWQQAARESERLKSLFPDDPRINELSREIELRRQAHKRHLLQEYDRAVQAQEVDRAHRLLLELDAYLSPNEGAALKESARGVFKARLQQMGVQFSLAVTEREFRKAIEIGQRLTKEYPNSRYAHEIANMLPVLRQRAAQQEQAREEAGVGA